MAQEPASKSKMTPMEADVTWREFVRAIMRNQLIVWPRRWTFRVNMTKEMYEAMEGKRPWSPFDDKKKYPLPHTPEDMKAGAIILPPIEMPPPSSYPRTSTGLYGWRPMGPASTLLQTRLNLIKNDYGKHDIVKSFGWPGPMP